MLTEKAEGLREITAVLGEALAAAEPHLRLDTPYLRASRAFIPSIAQGGELDARRAADPSAQRPAGHRGRAVQLRRIWCDVSGCATAGYWCAR